MSQAPFMQLYVGDYLADTLDLTCEEHGAYLLILMTMWRHEAKLPSDHKKLARIARLSGRKWAAVWSEIERFFDDDGVHITNKRLAKEYKKASDKSEIRSEAGRKGGFAKALKDNNATLANATPLPCHSSEPEPDIRKKKKETPLSPNGDRFDDFWAAVPRKVGKADARKAWAKACKSADPQAIIDAVSRYAVEREGQDPKYTKHPAAWLNAERWTDEAPASQQDFHNMISQALGGTDAISGPRENDHVTTQRLSAPLQAPGPSGPERGADRTAGDGRGNEWSYSNVFQPKRFGGSH